MFAASDEQSRFTLLPGDLAQSGRSAPAPVLAAVCSSFKSSHFLQASKTVFAIKQIEDSPHD